MNERSSFTCVCVSVCLQFLRRALYTGPGRYDDDTTGVRFHISLGRGYSGSMQIDFVLA